MPTPQATILYYTSETWKLEPKFDLQFEHLPRRCYIFLPVDNYPKDVQQRLRILRHFDAPPVLSTKMCTEINGYFGSRSKYDENERLKSYSTWMRCLVKMLLKEPGPDGKDYKWNEMTLLSRWDYAEESHQVLCIDTPDHFPEKMLDALRDQSGESHIQPRSGLDYFKDPFSMHAPLLDQVVEWNDKSVWAIRNPIRDIEKRRPTDQPDFDIMHEISRHSIHVSEVLLVTIQNFEMLREQQLYMHKQGIEPCKLTREYREQAHEYLNFQIQMLRSLRERSISNHSRLVSEITVAYNRIAQQDNRVMKAIAFLTMTFLPAAFISSFFSTTFFSYGKEGLETSKQMWVYWIVTIPSTLLVVIFWRVLFHRKAPFAWHPVQRLVQSIFWKRKGASGNKETKVPEKNPV